MIPLSVEEASRALHLSKLQAQLLALYCEGMAYDHSFVVEMGREIKRMNAAELRHNISVLADRR
jgi:hypothetical protein